MVLFLAHSFCCVFMTGLIWTIQLVHYPAFSHVEEARFAEFAAFHARRITWIVAPVMLLELTTAGGLWYLRSDILWSLNLGLLLLTWLSTFLWSVPCHDRLSVTKNPVALHDLVVTNWPRTLLWSLRSLLLLAAASAGGGQ